MMSTSSRQLAAIMFTDLSTGVTQGTKVLHFVKGYSSKTKPKCLKDN